MAAANIFPAVFASSFPGEGYPQWPFSVRTFEISKVGVVGGRKVPAFIVAMMLALVVSCEMKRGNKKNNSPVPFPTVCKVASGPRVSKSSFISSAQKQGGGGGGEHLNITAQPANSAKQAFKPTYGGSSKGTAVHRRAPRLCWACLMNAIIPARQ